MRLAAYAGASTALAAGAILRAFHERPNFYSASVYLAQSSACRMILVNFLLLSAGTLLFCLQRLLYGPLRAIEIEQLWERGWYTIMETALAMTTFRDEVGVWTFVMFVCLLAGKVWGWISEGRVEMLEQQPPANPKLFHTRLVASLLLSQIFDLVMLRYCVRSLLEQPRPGMMVMLAFEYAVLAINSSSTCARYGLSLNEMFVVKAQTKARLEERREEIRAAQEETEQGRPSAEATTEGNPSPEDIDENDIDVPGWQEKGRWVLFLDLLTDFLKLTVYVSFFSILIMFHGLPLHIIRDLYLTTRSFYKRINDYLKYRNATRDMNSRYPDATAEDLQRDGTCIICREDMRPWQQPQAAPAPAPGARRRPLVPTDERQRPKKLPCGHILHFGCLRSWLERQQVCPTCRRSVLVAESSRNNGDNQAGGNGGNALAVRPRHLLQGQQPQNQPNQDHDHNHNRNNQQQHMQRNQPRQQGQNDWRARTFNLGALRVTFAAGNPRQFQDAIRQMQDQNGNQQNRREPSSTSRSSGENGDAALSDQIAAIETRIVGEINQLSNAQEQLGGVRALQAELNRLRNLQANPAQRQGPTSSAGPRPQPPGTVFSAAPAPMSSMQDNPTLARHGLHYPAYQPHPYGTSSLPLNAQQQVLVGQPQATALGPGDPGLPEGMMIPEGWSLLPLQRHSPPQNDSSPQNSNSSLEELEVLGQVQPTVAHVQETQAPRPSTGVNPTLQENNPSHQTATVSNSSFTAEASTDNRMDGQISGQEINSQTSNDVTERLDTVPNLPNWSFASTGGPSTAGQGSSGHEAGEGDGHVSNADTSELLAGEESRGNGHVTKDKGKGKAVTVEDDMDEGNGL